MGSVLIVSAHDARSKRKANIHFIAAELARRTNVRWFSAGFSSLSKLRGRDPRLGLEQKANKVEVHESIECFLWRSLLHPGNICHGAAQRLTAAWFEAYRKTVPKILAEWASSADIIFVESGFSVLFLEQIRRAAPSARIIYIASDDLKTIKADSYLQEIFQRDGHFLSSARVPARELARCIPAGVQAFYVPHGIDMTLNEKSTSPFTTQSDHHAVSVGSMLFDPLFFEIACSLFCNIEFHVIGSGVNRKKLPRQVVFHEEMPFRKTLPFLQNCSFGIAPYKIDNLPYYISGSSMKLMQYDFLGLPSVCPDIAVGARDELRCGYIPGNKRSIESAINAALAKPHGRSGTFLSWGGVVDRLLAPDSFADTAI